MTQQPHAFQLLGEKLQSLNHRKLQLEALGTIITVVIKVRLLVTLVAILIIGIAIIVATTTIFIIMLCKQQRACRTAEAPERLRPLPQRNLETPPLVLVTAVVEQGMT